MSTLKEAVQQYNDLHAQITEAAQEAFQKYSDAGLIRTEHLEDGEYVMKPYHGYQYDKFEVDLNWDFIEITGEVYAGCGEYDHTTIKIPLSAFDNFDAFIEQEKAKIAAEDQAKVEKKAAEAAKAKAAQEKAEREQYARLKEKYEN